MLYKQLFSFFLWISKNVWTTLYVNVQQVMETSVCLFSSLKKDSSLCYTKFPLQKDPEPDLISILETADDASIEEYRFLASIPFFYSEYICLNCQSWRSHISGIK